MIPQLIPDWNDPVCRAAFAAAGIHNARDLAKVNAQLVMAAKRSRGRAITITTFRPRYVTRTTHVRRPRSRRVRTTRSPRAPAGSSDAPHEHVDVARLAAVAA